MHIFRLLILFFTFSLCAPLAEAQNPTIVYVGDPMCSWCYGFAPEITQLKNEFPDYNFKVVLGGLRPGGTETNKELGAFLLEHWPDVEKRTGQKFNYDILKDPTLVYDTEPAARAVVVARTMKPEIELAFFKAVQTTFYIDAANMRSTETFVALAKKFGLDSIKYKSLFESNEMKAATQADFQLASQMGVRGFPSLLLNVDGKLYPIANGYMSFEGLKKNIEKVKSDL
jgi:putative protein-disulfide isomerase